MCRVAVRMVEMVGMGVTLCWFATLRGAIWVLCGGASTFGLGVERVAKGPTGMGLGERSF